MLHRISIVANYLSWGTLILGEGWLSAVVTDDDWAWFHSSCLTEYSKYFSQSVRALNLLSSHWPKQITVSSPGSVWKETTQGKTYRVTWTKQQLLDKETKVVDYWKKSDRSQSKKKKKERKRFLYIICHRKIKFIKSQTLV